MLSFTEILTASAADLVKFFYKINPDENDDFIQDDEYDDVQDVLGESDSYL